MSINEALYKLKQKELKKTQEGFYPKYKTRIYNAETYKELCNLMDMVLKIYNHKGFSLYKKNKLIKLIEDRAYYLTNN